MHHSYDERRNKYDQTVGRNRINNWEFHKRGQNIPKGYGTQFTPVASARQREQVGVARFHSGTDQFRARQARGHARGFESGALEKQVQENLKRLGKRYNGAVLCKEYRGTIFRGKVRSTVWNRLMGYGVWVI